MPLTPASRKAMATNNREKYYERIHDIASRSSTFLEYSTDELHRNVASRRLNHAVQACQDHRARAAHKAMLVVNTRLTTP